MKFAAFISIIVSVAVMFAACQGAVGPAGKDGADGKDGATGKDGTDGQDGDRGPMGYSALVTKGDIPVIHVNDGDKRGTATIGDLPDPMMASDYFLGGYPEITYSLAKWNYDSTTDPGGDSTADAETAPNSVFTVALKDGVITIAKRAEADAVVLDANDAATVAAHYGMGTGFQVMAKDATGTERTTDTIYVRRNRAPTNHDSNTYGALTVGTQADFAASATAADKKDDCNKL